ncbi:MAG: hypothetical protein L0215_04320 [Gemmataceae bacterium]|nr:hypothetical protein [Gemmataceae bacterium]
MIPPILLEKLAVLRRRERLLDLAWGGARCVALVIAALTVGCFLDWLIDRSRDTPWALRHIFFILQLLVAGGALLWCVLLPISKNRSDDDLALEVEDKHPKLAHRLISAVQLNMPYARTEGMSPELVQVVTKEAVARAEQIDFAKVADPRWLRRGLAFAGPALAFAALAFLLWPSVVGTLVARQFLADVDIPRNVAIAPVDSAAVWPSGEKGQLRFRVAGQDLDRYAGEVVVRPDGGAADRFPLEKAKDTAPAEAEYVAHIPASVRDFTFSAWFGDGRTRKPARIRYEPRPVILDIQAWVQLPAFCGRKPDGARYEQPQARGDIVGIPGSAARLRIITQKPVKSAVLQLLGPEKFDPEKSSEELGPETVKRQLVFALDKSGKAAQGVFDLRTDEYAYRLVVRDEFDFDNRPPPRRAVRLIEEEPPQVALLKEQFPPAGKLLGAGPAEDFEVEGMPVPPGGAVRIAFVASGPYGLGQAKLLYRVLKKVESGNEDPGEEPWIMQPLPETAATDKVGPFDPRRGVFEHTGPKDQIFFHAVPSLDPENLLPRTLGGGRFDFKTTGIPDGKGGLLVLKVGDQIEFCIEMYADKDGKSDRPVTRSETRVKTIVSLTDFARWMEDTLQEERRLRQLDAKQRGLFDEK